MPMGVMAPIPVMTTRRRMDECNGCERSAPRGLTSPRLALRNASQAGERARRDTVNEYRADHRRGCEDPDQRPLRAVPDVQDPDARSAVSRREAPLHVHPRRNTPDMAK